MKAIREGTIQDSGIATLETGEAFWAETGVSHPSTGIAVGRAPATTDRAQRALESSALQLTCDPRMSWKRAV